MSRKQWPALCRLVEQDDGLPVRPCGPWTERKLVFWSRYIDITTTAMVGHPKWNAGLVYADLFAGPGISRIEPSGKRIPGSPLIAAHAPKAFERIIVCEKDRVAAAACKARLEITPAGKRCHVIAHDCNAVVADIAALIPPRALTLAFIDPTGLHAQYETIAALSQCGRVDLLVLFADAYDIVRNADLYRQQEESNLDLVLGADSNWRKRWDNLVNRTSNNIRTMFAEIYVEQLKKLHYRRFGQHCISGPKGALYRLIYTSKHERGLDFWDKVTAKDPSGQRHLF